MGVRIVWLEWMGGSFGHWAQAFGVDGSGFHDTGGVIESARGRQLGRPAGNSTAEGASSVGAWKKLGLGASWKRAATSKPPFLGPAGGAAVLLLMGVCRASPA